MLRITTHNDPGSLTFRLEGRLAGNWVRELEECWQRTLATPAKPAVCFDLTELTFMRTASAQCRYFTSLPDAGALGEIWKLEDQQYAAYFPALGGWCTGRPAYTGAPRAIINCPSCRFVVMGFE